MRFLLCQLRGPKRNDTPITISIPSTQILVSNTVLEGKDQGSCGGPCQGWADTAGMSQEHLLVLESESEGMHEPQEHASSHWGQRV